jgi:XRE family transcriptional regulator, aerobic/anaerobic benzoate catabolism transcriptional regulator
MISAEAPAFRSAEGGGRALRDPFLTRLGERVRSLRAERGMTRRTLAREAEVSERHLANLESGRGNGSVLVLRRLARALGCALTDILAEVPGSAERVLLSDLLQHRSEQELKRARVALTEMFRSPSRAKDRARRIALIGLRGAGKTTLGQMLADDLGVPFVEINREIERLAGCSVAEIHALYGASAYRRYERRALEETLRRYSEAVIATPGGLVSDAATLSLLLEQCFAVWLQATPEEHMNRVLAQGDLRPMAGNAEAMSDLKRILAGREEFYAKADLAFSTSGKPLARCFAELRAAVRDIGATRPRAGALPG